MTDPREQARRWAATWQRGWEDGELESIVGLYASEATFSSQPFREIHRGRAGVREYVAGAFADESDVRARFAEPIVEGDRACVQWWAGLIEGGEEMTLAGTSVLRFDADGLVLEQSDTWNQAAGRRDPPAGWARQRDT